MPKRKYVVKCKEFQKRFQAVDNGKGWLSRHEETWEKVKHNPQALKTKFRELKKVKLSRLRKSRAKISLKSTPT